MDNLTREEFAKLTPDERFKMWKIRVDALINEMLPNVVRLPLDVADLGNRGFDPNDVDSQYAFMKDYEGIIHLLELLAALKIVQID